MAPTMFSLDSLGEAIATVALRRSRLIFIDRSQAEHLMCSDFASLDLNRVLTAELMHVPRKERPLCVVQTMERLINEVQDETVQIIGIDVLFDPTLVIDPIRLFKACSRRKTLLVLWPGDITDSELRYATPSHGEYRTYKASDINDAIIYGRQAAA